ncbi:MAG: hypothetical protein IH600_11465 [Bacteroidetes bacterium]|nr:hypothetical protein [Bacteroidota bacterium]
MQNLRPISRVLAAAALMCFAAFLLVRCDFPSDPPLKSSTTDPPAVEPTDSTGVLLPLSRHIQWVYLFEAPPRPVSAPRIVSPRELDFEGSHFYYVPYTSTMGGPGSLRVAFPVLLRNDSLGLSFYQPVRAEDTLSISLRPKFMFTLPYPAREGKMYTGRNPEFSVRMTNKDTLVTMYNHPVSLPCHRYEVWRGARVITVLYVVPGLCILRVEEDDMVYHTIGWSI